MEDPITKISNDIPHYWEGTGNLLIRLYVYLQLGFTEAKNAQTIVLGILAFYGLAKLNNAWWMLWIALIITPILITVGRYKLYRVSKIGEYITTIKGSVVGYNAYNVQVQQNELLQQILKELQNIGTNKLKS